MNAKAMFDFANYDLEKETDLGLVYSHRLYPHFIYFDKQRRHVCKYAKRIAFGIYEHIVVPEAITLTELKAINQQIKELGWND